MFFLIATEYGEMYWASTINENDITAAESGLISIIDILNKQIFVGGGVWNSISEWSNK